jgi:AraC-like DNA-binding protein
MLRFQPGPRTAGFVERYTIVESDDEATRVLLPEPGLHLGVRYRGAATMIEDGRATRLADLVVTGLRDSSRTMQTHAGGGIVVALFRPTGAAAMFRAPLHELFGATVPLDALVSAREARLLAERVAAPADPAARVAALEEVLAARVATPRTDPLVERAVAALVASRGTVRIGALADELDLGQDALEKRFRRIVGGAPKQLASLLRVRHAIELGAGGQSWSTVAHRAGYFDQSHFIREFRAMTGRSPARFFREVEHCAGS